MTSTRVFLLGSLLGPLACLTACDGGEGSDAGPPPVLDDAGSPGPDAGPPAVVDDAGPSDAGALPDAGPPPGVGAFVAIGWGGRRITSCDQGRTWVGDRQDADEADDDWHRPYTPKGLAFGGGVFVALTGWGNPSSVHVSADGVTWTSQVLDTTYGAVGWSDGRFVLVGNRRISASDDLGVTWAEQTDAPASTYDRAAGAFDGVWAAGSDAMVQTRRPGGAWEPLPSCVGARHGHIGFQGGFAAGGDVLLSVGHDGDTCALAIGSGADLGASTIGNGPSRGPAYFDGAFHVVAGGAVHRSTDGVTWSAAPLPSGVRFDLLAESDEGTQVGVSADGDAFYYRDPGGDWTPATAPTGNGLHYLVFGRVATCGGS